LTNGRVIVEFGRASCSASVPLSTTQSFSSSNDQATASGGAEPEQTPSPSEQTPSPSTTDNESPRYTIDNLPKISLSSWVQSKDLGSMVAVWLEFSVGSFNIPPISLLEEKYGASWRKSAAARKFYSRRKIFYDAVKQRATARALTNVESARELETKRAELDITVAAMQDWIKLNGAAWNE
jgi:hypothetical protein